MTSSLFDAARRAISRSLIESLLPGGEWRSDGDYWVRSPLRADESIGSFHVNEEGLWKDFASKEGGDLINLVVAMRGCSKVDAAEEIVRLGGGSVPERASAKTRKQKPMATIPIPDVGREAINKEAYSEWAKKRYGEPMKGWRYHTERGEFAFVVIRYDTPGGKQCTQFYWDGHEAVNGIPPQCRSSRPLYKLPELIESSLPKLIVEGEKCADVEVSGFFSTTWCGGCASTDKTDWSPLAKEAQPIIWPDADYHRDKQGRLLPDSMQPGIKAALAIQNRLPNAVILDTRKYAEHKDGWDIADAQAEGIDLVAFIHECPRLDLATEATTKLPFSFLGYDSGSYWFLPRKRRVPFTIDMGRFTGSQLLELAPLGFWANAGFLHENNTVRLAEAQDWIISEAENTGMVDLRRLRGAGVWRDGAQIVVNDGAQIVTMAGDCLEYEAFKSSAAAEYIPSETRFGDMTGEESTDIEGAALAALFCSQRFSRSLDPVAALGWALIAPFGGLLKWRPHLWITGRRGTGKSTVLIEKMIDPLIGEFAYQGTGRSSEAALRRALNMTARPARLDEFDARAKNDLERLSRVVILARNSSCDSTAITTLASGDNGLVQFVVRSCFLFASVNLLDLDAAIQSRIVRVEKLALSKMEIEVEIERMRRECSRVMADPARFRRRIFRALPRILSDIDAVHERLLSYTGDAREADLIAPLLCAAWAVQSVESIMGEAGTAWCVQLLEDLSALHDERVEDEQRVIEHLLAAQIRTDDMHTRTVAELLRDSDMHTGQSGAEEILSRQGMRITNYRNGDGRDHRVLALAIGCDPISKMLEGTTFAHDYDAQLKRHPLCLNQQHSRQIRFALGRARCRLLDWEGFREKYLGSEMQGQLEMGGDDAT